MKGRGEDARGGEGRRAADVWCVLSVGGQKQQSQMVRHTTNPDFDETFIFEVGEGLRRGPGVRGSGCWAAGAAWKGIRTRGRGRRVHGREVEAGRSRRRRCRG